MKKNGAIRLLLTGGGTGGHLFPALAAAQEMCRERPDTEVLFLGTRRKMDKTSLADSGYSVKSIHCYGLKGKKLLPLLKAVAVLPVSFVEAAFVISRFKPDVVLGVGGYVTGPVVAAAKMLGKKTIIHEQNSVPGLANRKLGSLADKICISLPQSSKYFDEEKTVFTGNPVRKSILDLAAKDQQEEKTGSKTVLILGGSQGAHRVNELVVEALCRHGAGSGVNVIHQTGSADAEMVRKAYIDAGISAVVAPFFSDMASIYDEADLLISRAGATTLAELSVLGKPALLIPYPFAADNHQEKNAQHYVDGGGCRMFRQRDLDGAILASELKNLLTDGSLLQGMAKNMKKLGLPDAAAKIVDVCLGDLKNM